MRIRPLFLCGIAVWGCAASQAAAQKMPAPRESAATPTQPTQSTLQDRVASILKEIPPGARIGLVVTTADGREMLAIRPDDRFVPASNTKLFTTAAAYSFMPELAARSTPRGNAIFAGKGKHPDLTLVGYGDARMSSAPDCAVNCLATLADAIAKSYRTVGAITGDDSYFADERWSSGMAWNNIPGWYGTAISALTVDDNELVLTIAPGLAAGEAAILKGLSYFTLDNQIRTVESGDTKIDYHRLPNSRVLHLTGTIAMGKTPSRVRLGIDDPAHYAAWRLGEMLKERKVKVKGGIASRHRFAGQAPTIFNTAPLASLTPEPLSEDINTINKVSQNLHSELMLRRVGLARGEASVESGLKGVEAMMTAAGVARTAYDFSDGSGMSTYNRVSPRASVKFLRWSAAQPWGRAWRESLPIAGVDGTLARRFKGTLLEGKLFAKTGSVNQATSLSGYLTTARGQTLIFSSFVNDIPGDASASGVIDKALVLIAAEN